MAGADNKIEVNGPSLAKVIDGFEQHLSVTAHQSPVQISLDLKRGWSQITSIMEDIQEIVDEHKSNPVKMAEELQEDFGITLTPAQYLNPEPAIIAALQLRDASQIEHVIGLIEAQEQLADSFPGLFSNVADMMEFMVEHRERFTQSSYGIDANGTNRPAMEDMGFITLAKSGQLHNVVQNIIEAGADISTSQMQNTWAKNPEGIEATFHLNNSLETLTNKGPLESIGDFAKDVASTLSRGFENESTAALEFANSVYGSDAKSIDSFIPFIEAQEALATEHFGGDKVKMAEFFVQHVVTGPTANMPFADFVKSGEADSFIKEQRSLTNQYNIASQATPYDHIQTLLSEFKSTLSEEQQLKFVDPTETITPIDTGGEMWGGLSALTMHERKYDDFVSGLTDKQREEFETIIERARETGVPLSGERSFSPVELFDIETIKLQIDEPIDEPADKAEPPQKPEQQTPEDIIEKSRIESKEPDTDSGPYIVQKGDRLDHIIQDHYDTDPDNPMTPAQIIELRNIVGDYNSMKNVDHLKINQKIKLPSATEIAAIRDGTHDKPEEYSNNGNTPAFTSEIQGLQTLS